MGFLILFHLLLAYHRAYLLNYLYSLDNYQPVSTLVIRSWLAFIFCSYCLSWDTNTIKAWPKSIYNSSFWSDPFVQQYKSLVVENWITPIVLLTHLCTSLISKPDRLMKSQKPRFLVDSRHRFYWTTYGVKVRPL